MKLKNLRQGSYFYLLLYGGILVILFLITPERSWPFDTMCWVEWSSFDFKNGLGNAYKSWTDYLPLYHYVLFLYGKLMGSHEAISEGTIYLKYFTLLFELASTLLLFKLLKRKFEVQKAFLLSLAFFLNPAVLYNSMIWGQIDGILSFFVFSSILLMYYQRFTLSLLCFVLAINLKLQAIIFLPLLLGLGLYSASRLSVKNILTGLLAAAILQFLILSPFMMTGDLDKVWNVVAGSKGKYPFVSMNAYNFWELALKGNLEKMPDNLQFAGIKYHDWGLLLFFISSFFALLFLLKPLWQRIVQNKNSSISFNRILLAGALIPLLFFYFNTQMHERYSHPAIIFLVSYCLLNRRFLPVLALSLAYFLNLEDIFKFLELADYNMLFFRSWFVSCLYLGTILFLFYEMFKPEKAEDFVQK